MSVAKNKEPLNPVELWKLMDRARFALARLRSIELSQFGVTIEQSSILRALYEEGGSMTTKELENLIMRQPNSISILINRMIGMGLINRGKQQNKKSYRIYLTKQGEELIKNVTQTSLEIPFSTLKDEEKKQMALYLETLLDKARYLLGIPHQTPFMKYLGQKNITEDTD
jgi:DNA-binding MarR family transcriptional regulator